MCFNLHYRLKKVQSKKKERAAVEDAIRERKASEEEEGRYHILLYKLILNFFSI